MEIPGDWIPCLRWVARFAINFQKRHIFSTVCSSYGIDIEHYFSFEPNVSKLDTLQLILRCLVIKIQLWN